MGKRHCGLAVASVLLALTACKSADEKLLSAVESGDVAVVRALEKKANSNAMDREGNPALIVALVAGHPEVAMALLEAGARADVTDTMKRSALLLAARAGYRELVDVLLAKGAPTDARDVQGRTLLHLACAAGDEALVTTLIDKKVDLDGRDGAGKTGLHLAIVGEHVTLVRRLLDAGARTDIADDRGVDAATAASAAQNAELVAMFRADAKSRAGFADGALRALTQDGDFGEGSSSVRLLDGSERYSSPWDAPWTWRKAIALGAASLAYGPEVAGNKLHLAEWPSGLAAERSQKDDDVVADAVAKIVGKSWILERRAVGNSFLNAYDPRSLGLLFDRYYCKPDERILGIATSALYYMFGKSLARTTVRATLTLLKSEQELARMAKDYVGKVEGGADGVDAVAVILSENYHADALLLEVVGFDGALAVDLEPEPLDSDWGTAVLGTLMRRQLDGTLPVIARAAVRFLGDYDPDFGKALKAELEAKGIL